MALKTSSYDSLALEEPPKPKRRNDGGGIITFLVTIAVVLAVIFIPSLYRPLLSMIKSPAHPTLDPAAVVWVSKDAGTYFCADSVLYGHGAGSFMRQGDALTGGYQPALGDYCARLAPQKPARRVVAVRPSYGATSISTPATNATLSAQPR